jgi:BirA family biotin operon repressor/biotin-[acetyl-CoA-carboxylase] ligase
MTKDEILSLLWQNADDYVSGGELARRLSVSRTAVWKAIGQLKDAGYEIESVPKRGYRLRSASDVLSEDGISRHLRHRELTLRVYKTISSTNTVLKGLAAEGAPEGLVLLSEEQTAGRGRMGRSFYSPPASGLYLSILLRPNMPAAAATRLTACAAVAVAETIEELSNRGTQIKWVNDIFMDGRKVCGILTEASLDCESGMMHYVIIGIGVNTHVPAGDFPEALGDIAGAAFGAGPVPELRCRLAAGILERIMDYSPGPAAPAVYEGYKSRSLVLGKHIDILSPGREPESAVALDLAEDYALIARMPDGSLRRLSSGEVSVKV